MMAAGTVTVPFVGHTMCLFGHKVSDHVGRRSESGGDISQLDVLAAEMEAHVDVARSKVVGGVQCHDDGAFIDSAVRGSHDVFVWS